MHVWHSLTSLSGIQSVAGFKSVTGISCSAPGSSDGCEGTAGIPSDLTRCSQKATEGAGRGSPSGARETCFAGGQDTWKKKKMHSSASRFVSARLEVSPIPAEMQRQPRTSSSSYASEREKNGDLETLAGGEGGGDPVDGVLLEELADGAAVAAAQTEVQLRLQRVGGLREGDRAQAAEDLRFARLEEVLRLDPALAVRQDEDVRCGGLRDDAVPDVSRGGERKEDENRTCMSGVSL